MAWLGLPGLESHSKSPVSQGVARSGSAMEAVGQNNSYQCDRCGSTNVVAAPVIYGQGTRTYSGTFNSGNSKSQAAIGAAPPNPRGYARPIFLWGFGIVFACFWGFAGFRAIARFPQTAGTSERSITLLVVVALVCLIGLILNFYRIARYNREVYPRLHWNWEHTYICRRCGRSLLISS